MDLLEIQEYSIEIIESLIANEVEENIHLDYKASGALGKKDEKKSEIVKDVSAFANSDGGIIIYGLTEENHKPKEFDFVDGNVFTKEWLENIIHQVQPHIEGIMVTSNRVFMLSKYPEVKKLLTWQETINTIRGSISSLNQWKIMR